MFSLILVVPAHPQYRVNSVGKGFSDFSARQKKSDVRRQSESEGARGGQAADEYDEYFEYSGALWKQAWDYQHQCYCWCEVRREDGHCFLPFFSAALGVPPALLVTWSRPRCIVMAL